MTAPSQPAAAGLQLVLSEECDGHLLGDEKVVDGDRLDLLTEGGWVSGHYRSRLHAETGYPVFEVHLGVLDAQPPIDKLEHAVIHLPPQAILRRSAAQT